MGRYNSKLELRTHKVKLPQVNKYNKFNISVLKIIRIQKNGTKISRSRNRFGNNLLLCRCISTRKGRDHCQRSRQSNNAVIRSFTDTERLIGDAAKNQVALNPSNTIFDAKRL